ncbi:glycoprotein hormone beta-5-like isoform X1 [Hippoglossus hippoglossus]|uniref:glycoprotein hormone beta-5-like isoform X1 n=2 Tax=Hippoglossus hippoglossus TaxID=8267 RepID=UPI00148E3AF2|nr:glycoprotein hormone beta-5-like isoform X1 [Hippoglossus hippoglossus]
MVDHVQLMNKRHKIIIIMIIVFHQSYLTLSLYFSPPSSIPSMHLHPLTLSLFILLVGEATVMCVVVTTALHGFRGCAVREFSFVAQKPGCKGLRITTEACWGRCHTWEKPVPDPPYIQRNHRVCTYSRSRHMTARLPGCPPNVSPLYHYPMALHCHCAICSTQDTECETF